MSASHFPSLAVHKRGRKKERHTQGLQCWNQRAAGPEQTSCRHPALPMTPRPNQLYLWQMVLYWPSVLNILAFAGSLFQSLLASFSTLNLSTYFDMKHLCLSLLSCTLSFFRSLFFVKTLTLVIVSWMVKSQSIQDWFRKSKCFIKAGFLAPSVVWTLCIYSSKILSASS